MNPLEVMRAMIGSRGPGLEIGPLHRPIAPKRDGYNVVVVDHTSTQGLREKYAKDPNVDVSLIEEVDYVTDGRSILETIGQSGRYDWIIASHVIEHTPDLLGFLKDCERLLRPVGTLALAIPHRRFCFDALRPISTMGQVLQAHLEKRTRLSPGTLFDFVSESSKRNGLGAWFEGQEGQLVRVHPITEALNIFRQEATSSAKYRDGHAWVFVPASFRLILQMAQEMGMIELRESQYHETIGCEFFVSLSRSGAGTGLTDDELRRAAEEEQLAGFLERFNLFPGRVTRKQSDAPGAEKVGSLVVDRLRMLLLGTGECEKDGPARRLWRLAAPLRAVARKLRG